MTLVCPETAQGWPALWAARCKTGEEGMEFNLRLGGTAGATDKGLECQWRAAGGFFKLA